MRRPANGHHPANTPISETEYWLWQEYLPTDAPWTLADYRTAAYRLGQWQAAAERPDYPWLCRDWMAGWVHGPLTGIFGLVEGMNGRAGLVRFCLSRLP